MTKERFKSILQEEKFQAEFKRFENGVFYYSGKIKYYKDDNIRVSKYIAFEIPINKVNGKILSNTIDDMEYIQDFAML